MHPKKSPIDLPADDEIEQDYQARVNQMQPHHAAVRLTASHMGLRVDEVVDALRRQWGLPAG